MNLIELIDAGVTKILGRKIRPGYLQFFRYLICGAAATLSDMAVLYALTHFLAVNHLAAAGLGFLVGMATNYTLNTILVFQSSGKVKKEFFIFAVIGMGGLLWTEFILWVLVDNLNFKIMVAKIVAVILVLNWNFFMRKKLVFPNKSNLENLEKSI